MRKIYVIVCLQLWDHNVSGNCKYFLKVKFFHEVREYSNLNHDNITIEETLVYPNERPQLKNVEEKTIDSRKDEERTKNLTKDKK